jgi:hypothetical protein
MNEPLDEAYLRWLYSQVASPRLRSPHKTFWKLLRTMFRTEFFWTVPNDDNRVEDGRVLRNEFLEKSGARCVDPDWLALGCSFLEMMIALCRRLEFEAGVHPSDWWFWHLIENLELEDCTDASDTTEEVIRQKLDVVIWRTYKPNGHGGLFPLDRPRVDQRKIELWYQLNNYLLTNGYV